MGILADILVCWINWEKKTQTFNPNFGFKNLRFHPPKEINVL